MPYIKDKYKAKGGNVRSSFVNRKENPAIKESAPVGLTNQQRDQINAENFRAISNESAQNQLVATNLQTTTTTTTEPLSHLKGFVIQEANVVQEILTLQQGSSLNNIIIQNTYNANAVINIYWSAGDQSRASFTVSTGNVTDFKGISLVTIFGDSFVANGTISLEHLVAATYKNVSNPITFYAVSSIAGPSITLSVNNG
tara:strand:+ start:1244 stop:1840 length:597 start_codon:yes stop_codon:yes gene_type:complete